DDTLVTAITLWSVPTKLFDSQPRTLFVTGAVDSAAPDIHNVIYGPRTVVHLDTDPINPIPYRFEFQPPLQLPQKGSTRSFSRLAMEALSLYWRPRKTDTSHVGCAGLGQRFVNVLGSHNASSFLERGTSASASSSAMTS